jgi:hypothetical protein
MNQQAGDAVYRQAGRSPCKQVQQLDGQAGRRTGKGGSKQTDRRLPNRHNEKHLKLWGQKSVLYFYGESSMAPDFAPNTYRVKPPGSRVSLHMFRFRPLSSLG